MSLTIVVSTVPSSFICPHMVAEIISVFPLISSCPVGLGTAFHCSSKCMLGLTLRRLVLQVQLTLYRNDGFTLPIIHSVLTGLTYAAGTPEKGPLFLYADESICTPFSFVSTIFRFVFFVFLFFSLLFRCKN